MTHQHPRHLLIFGSGYVAGFLAQAATRQGWQVTVVTRMPEHAGAQIQQWGAVPLAFGAPLPETATHGVMTAPPAPEDGTDPVLATYTTAALRHLQRLVYLSSTGVYGDTDGTPVDETAPLLARAPRGVARVAAEAHWHTSALPVDTLRLSGIYGPGRNMLERLKEGRIAGLERSTRPVNRIHVADIVQAILACLNTSLAPTIYNLADDTPAPTADVIAYAATLLGQPCPPPQHPNDSHLMDGSRIVLNQRLKTALGVQLQYPDYRAGLQALHAPSNTAKDSPL